MNADDSAWLEEQFPLLLTACDEALAAGAPAESLDLQSVPAEELPHIEREIAWYRRVRQLWRRAGSADPAWAKSTAVSDQPLTSLGRFQIRSELGRGTFGVVFLAHDPVLGREVALKVPRAEVLVTAELRSRFQQEARAAARLEHPNLVPVYEAGEEGSVCWIASAYCAGITLAAWLKQRTEAVPYRTAAQLLAALAEGMEHAHRRGVLHRDLKPSNVLLEVPTTGLLACATPLEDSGPATLDFVPRVTDFGLAKLVEGAAGASLAGCETQSGAIVGTAGYMAPEQASGHSKGVGPAADIYALGVILYEVLTGRPPFQGDTPLDTLVLVRTQEPLSPARLRLHLPRDLETICLKCLDKEPAKRYPSAGALAEDLRRYLAGEPIQARRVGYAGRLVRWCRRKPALSSTIALAVAAILVVSTVSFWQVVQERDRFRVERDRAEANLYRSLVGEARAQMQARDTGWWWNAMENLREASRLDVVARDPVELRELAIQCMGSQYACLRLAGEWSGHEGPVTSVAVSPDGRSAVSGSRDRTVRLWRMPEGQPLAVLTGHAKSVTGVIFHRDGRHVVSSSLDGSVRVWDITPWLGAEQSVPERSGAGVALAEGAVPPEQVFDLGAGAVRAVAYSADGAWLGAACEDKKLRLLPAGVRSLTPQPAVPPTEMRVLAGHTGPVNCLAFSPKGGVLVSGSADNTIRFWDLVTGEQTATWAVGNAPVTLTFSPDGNGLAWADFLSYGLATKNLQTNVLIAQGAMHASSVYQVVQRKYDLLTASNDGTLKIWARHPTANGYQERAVAAGEFGAVLSVATNRDERWVVAGYEDGRVRLWELADFPHRALLGGEQNALFVGDKRRLVSGSVLHDFSAGIKASTERYVPAATRALTIHPNGRSFAFGRDTGTLHIWDLECRRELVQWRGHGQGVSTLAASPDGKYLASASSEGAVKLWHWDSRLERVLDPGVGPIHQVAWSRDARQLAATGERGAVVWNMETQTGSRRLSERAQEASALAFGTNSLALSGVNGAVEIWDLQSWQKLRTLRGHAVPVIALEFSPDGNRLASAATDESIRLWNTSTGQEEAVLKYPGLGPSWLSFQPHGPYLVSGGAVNTNTTLIWDLDSKAAVANIEHEPSPCGGQFVLNGSAFLLGGVSGGLSLCTVADIDQARAAAQGTNKSVPVSGLVRVESTATIVPGGHVHTVWGVATSQDGRWVATASHDGTVKLWDGQNMQLVRTLAGHTDLVWCVAFSPDGKYLASGGADLKVWQVATGRELHPFDEHKRMVSSVAFHPNNRWLASGSYDGTVRLWDVAAGRSLGLLHQFGQVVNNLAFRPDGGWLACAGQDQQIHLWDLGKGLPTLPAPPDRTLTGHSATVWSVGWSADGLYLASGSERGVIILWNGETFSKVVTLRGGTGQIRSLSFSRDGSLLAGAAYVSATIVWDLPRLRQTLRELNVDW